MTDREILRELKKSYEYLYDIRENGCDDHCNGQLNRELAKELDVAIYAIEDIYTKFYKTLDKESLRILTLEKTLDNEKVYIAECVGEDYEVGVNYDSVSCSDFNYYWYDEKGEY